MSVKTIVLIAGSSCAVIACAWYSLRGNTRAISYWIEKLSVHVKCDYRSDFRRIVIRPLDADHTAHSHPTAAAIRTEMNQAIDDYISTTGRECYSVSMSCADERAGHRGNRYFYTAKDLSYGYRDDQLTTKDVVKMSDTGYYVDLPNYMDGHEIILYEIVPFRVVGQVADATYVFDSDSRLVEQVNGDAKYCHHLWDYSTDCVLVPKWYGTWQYLVEKIVHPKYPQYRIIGLFPRRFIPAPLSWLLTGKTLERTQVNNGSWNVLHSQHSEKGLGVQYISIAKLSSLAEAFLPIEVLESLAMRYYRLAKVDLGSVEMYLEHEAKRFERWQQSNQSLKTIATVVVDYITSTKIHAGPLISVPNATEAYVPVNKEYRPMTETQKCVVRNITPENRHPIVVGATAPIAGRAAEYCAVDVRIIKVRNDVEPPRRFSRYRREFVDLLVTEKHVGRPYSDEILDDRMPRATQRSITQRFRDWYDCDKPVNKAFVKPETYGAFVAPRVISTLPPTMKSKYALYMYAFVDDVLHHKRWYAFSKTPQTLCEALGKCAIDAINACCTDYSKFDGHISKFIRDFERMVLQAWACDDVRADLIALHAQQLKLRGATRLGIAYEAGNHRLSGSSETSAFNSIDNAFMQYCAYRETGLTVSDAYNALGVYGGDDGVSFDLDPKIATATANAMGFDLKCEAIIRGDVVPFLGRFWYNCWTGLPTSTCDWKRQVMKLHLTASHDLDFKQVMVGKALGFWYTDRETPIIGDWATRVLTLAGVRPVDVDGEMLPLNAASSWMAGMGVFEQPMIDVMERTMLTTTGWDEKTYHQILEFILSAQSLEQLYPTDKPLFSYVPETKIDCIHGGERKLPSKAPKPISKGLEKDQHRNSPRSGNTNINDPNTRRRVDTRRTGDKKTAVCPERVPPKPGHPPDNRSGRV